MAYYFAVETEENSYIAKNIRNSKYFGSMTRIHEPYACTLGEIDNFTSEFENEDKLKEQLLKENIINELDLDKRIAIIYTQGIKRRIVDGNILYSDSKSMINNSNIVINHIKEMATSKDYKFFRELSKKLPEGTINKSLVSKLASLIELSLTSDKNIELDNNMIDEVSKVLIYYTKIKEDGSITCTNEINQENLHNILSFISEYQKSLVKTSNKTKTLKNTSN